MRHSLEPDLVCVCFLGGGGGWGREHGGEVVEGGVFVVGFELDASEVFFECRWIC